MTRGTITQLVERLAQARPLTVERFAALLDVPLTPAETDPYWRTYTFVLTSGPFARGEVRLKATSDAALLVLEPRNPPGLSRAEVDAAALGLPVGVEPNPYIPPAGMVTEYFQKNGVQVAVQWSNDSNQLRSLVLNWEPPTTAKAAPLPSAAASANLN